MTVNPTRVWVRHITRAETGVTVVNVTFAAELLEGVNGRQGWQTGETTAQLADDGTVTITFPNTVGDDGVRHLDRFAILTDPAYRPGKEWIEVMREPHEPVAVFTPVTEKRSSTSIELSGYDVAGFLNRFRASEIDLWAHAPRDVFEHYTRLPYLATGRDFTSGWTGSGAAGTDNGWEFENVTASVGRATFSTTATASVSRAVTADGDCWTAHARVRITSPGDLSHVGLSIATPGGAQGMQVLAGGQVDGFGGVRAGAITLPNSLTITWPASIDLEIVARYDRLFFFANGQLMGSQKRAVPAGTPSEISAQVVPAGGATDPVVGMFETVHLEGHAPFALRGADKGDRHLPGLPTPGGLRARWFNEASNAAAHGTGTDFQAEALSPLAEPANTTLEPALDKPVGFTPASLPGEWSMLLTGAIRLDLAAGDTAVRLATGTGITARVFVGATMPGEQCWDTAAPTTYTALQAELGEVDGWWPIRIEIVSTANALASAALQLQTAPMVSGTPGAWTTVAEDLLSPYGCFEEDVRLETHRDMIKALTDQFGFQWVCEPRTLETGEFPGQVIPRVRAGRDYQTVIDAATGAEIEAQGDAGDTIDQLIVDAAGISRTDDQQQLTAKITDYETAPDQLGLVADYDSLAEITEEPMLRQRAGSMLTLRSSPNEQIGVRPVGRRDLEPLTLTGQLARMNWQPGDAVPLELDTVGVRDRSPRQMSRVTWPLRPDGFGRPQVAFRQRPRGAAVVMRRALRAGIVTQRNDPRLDPVSRYRAATA